MKIQNCTANTHHLMVHPLQLLTSLIKGDSLYMHQPDGKTLENIHQSNLDSFSKSVANKCFKLYDALFGIPMSLYPNEITALLKESISLNPKSPLEFGKQHHIRIANYMSLRIQEIGLPDAIADQINYIRYSLMVKEKTLPKLVIQSDEICHDAYIYTYPNLKLATFRYKLDDLMDKKLSTESLHQLSSGQYHYILRSEYGRTHKFEINKAVYDLLRLSNGVFTIEEIATRLQASYQLTLEDLMTTHQPRLIDDRYIYIKHDKR